MRHRFVCNHYVSDNLRMERGMVMKYFKGSLLVLAVVMMCSVFLGMGEVIAAEPDFFREYTADKNYAGEFYDFYERRAVLCLSFGSILPGTIRG